MLLSLAWLRCAAPVRLTGELLLLGVITDA
jgi:hypothetical protein